MVSFKIKITQQVFKTTNKFLKNVLPREVSDDPNHPLEFSNKFEYDYYKS